MTDEKKAVKVSKEAGIEVAAAAIGLAVSGPWGAIAGAAVRPLLAVIAEGDERGRRNVIRLGEAVRELTGLSEDELAAWVSSKDGRLALVMAATRAAHATHLDQKIQALARVVAESAHDDAQLQLGEIIISVLAELDAPHVRVLAAVCREQRPPHASEPVADGAWTLSQMKQHMPNLAAGMFPIAVKLAQLGILHEGLAASDGPAWTVTPFGHECLSYLDEAHTSAG